MKKYFNIGDRVRYSGLSDGWVENGETGTIVGWDNDLFCDLAHVSWDEFKSYRHSCGSKCASGHGWNVFTYNLEHDNPSDLGEFAAPDNIEELFAL